MVRGFVFAKKLGQFILFRMADHKARHRGHRGPEATSWSLLDPEKVMQYNVCEWMNKWIKEWMNGIDKDSSVREHTFHWLLSNRSVKSCRNPPPCYHGVKAQQQEVPKGKGCGCGRQNPWPWCFVNTTSQMMTLQRHSTQRIEQNRIR